MRRTALSVAVLIASGLLSACAIAQRNPNPCNGPNCQVQVTVTGCRVGVDNDPLRITHGPGPVTIVWKIDGGSLARDNGIYIKADGDPSSQVTSVGASGNTWVMVQKRTPDTKITYGINVLDSAGKACPPHDPIVVNEP